MNEETDPNESGGFDRRSVLKASAAAAVGGVAGCSGESGTGGPNDNASGGNDSTGGGDGSGGTPVDSDLTMAGGGPQVQFNPFNPKNYHDGLVLFDKLAKQRTPKTEFLPLIAQEWSLDGQTASLTLSDQYTWTNGKAVNATDVATRLRLGKYFGEPTWNYIESVEKTGEYAVEMKTQGTINADLLWTSLLPTKINTPPEIYGEYLTSLEEASSQSKRDDVKKELTQFSLQDPIGNGPFVWKGHEQQKFIHERHEDYPEIDKLNFPTLTFAYGGSKQKQAAGLKTGKIDGVLDTFLTPAVIQELPDQVMMLYLPADHGSGVYFNHNDDVFGDWRVRKAIAYAVNWKTVAESANFGSSEIKQQEFQSHNTGVLESRTDAYLKDVGNYEQYMETVDEEKAKKLLQSAGYALENNKWIDEKTGDRVKIPVKNPVEPSRNAAARDMLSQLKQFGFKTQLLTVEGTTYWGKTAPQGNYRITMGPSWGGFNYHPYFSFHMEFADPSRLSPTKFPAKKVKIPEQGNIGGPYDRTVNVTKKVKDLGRTQSESKGKKLVRELAWAWNQSIPCIGFTLTNDTHILTKDDWVLPEPDTELMDNIKYPLEVLVRPQIEGFPHMEAKTK